MVARKMHKNRPMKLLVDHGATNNIGDLAMLEGVVGELQRILPTTTLCVPQKFSLPSALWKLPRVKPVPDYHLTCISRKSSYPDQKIAVILRKVKMLLLMRLVLAGYDTSKLRLWGGCGDTLQALVSQYDGLHLSGGGYLNDTFAHELLKKLCLVKTFAAQGKKVVLSGQQVGPFAHKIPLQFLAKIICNVDVVGLRDNADSVVYCSKTGVPKQSVKIMGDDSFGCVPESGEGVLQMLKSHGLSPGSYVAINARLAGYALTDRRYLEHLRNILAGIHGALSMKYLFIPISFNTDDSDVQSGINLQKLCADLPVHLIKDPISASQAKSFLRFAYGAIGVSYHFCTFALSEGTPAVSLYNGVYYAHKSKGIASFWGDTRFSMDLNCPSERISSKIIELFQDDTARIQLNRIKNDKLAHWHVEMEDCYRGA